jgi:pyridoxine kinase
MPVISIHSSVAFGHAGNSAAVFPMQRLGVEVWPVTTVELSNHTGYPDWGGGAMPVEHVAAVLEGIERRGGFAKAEAILTGYMGSAELVRVVAGAVVRVKAANRRALACCDPVIGNDAKGLFVPEDAARAIAEELIPRADVATPNRFELQWLTARAVETVDDALAAAEVLAARGPRLVVVTSLPSDRGIGVLALSDDGAWLVTTPRLDVPANGAGDAFCAMFLARLVTGEPPAEALSLAASSIYAILAASTDGELALVAAQDEIASPSRRFEARRM